MFGQCPRRIVVHGTSTIYQPGPFSTRRILFHQQSVNLDHPPQGECMSTNNLFFLGHSPARKCLSTSTIIIHDAIYQHSLLTEEVISSLSSKGEISLIPSLPLKYENFILDRGFVKISVVFSSMEMYWRITSPFWNLSQIK
jgi:hypothetical protein